jgi:hypothetical protein
VFGGDFRRSHGLPERIIPSVFNHFGVGSFPPTPKMILSKGDPAIWK